MAKAKHDWSTLNPRIDNLKAQGRNNTEIAKELGIGRQTLVDHLRSRQLVHLVRPHGRSCARGSGRVDYEA